MKKLIINCLSFILFFTLSSCWYTNTNNKNQFVDNCIDYELEVYQSILYSIGFIRGYGPIPPPPPPPGAKDSFSLKERKEIELELVEFNSIMDTVKKYIFISDSLYVIDDDQIEYGDNIGYYNQIDNCSKIIEQLCDSNDKFSLIPVNASIVDKNFYDKFGFKEDGLYMGILSLSKVLFNEDYTKGCLSYSFVCGGKCAISKLLIVVKSGDKWKIKEEIFLSAS